MWCFILFQVQLASLQAQKVIHSNTSFKKYYSKLAVCRLLTMVIEDPQITKINLYISKQNPIKYVHFTIKEMKQKKLRICLSNGLYSVFCHILLNWLRRRRKLIKFSVSNYDKCSVINNKWKIEVAMQLLLFNHWKKLFSSPSPAYEALTLSLHNWDFPHLT